MARAVAWGDVRLVDFGKPDKTRPVLVLTRTGIVAHLSTVTVAPISRTIRGVESEITVGPDNGLKQESAVNFDHVQTIEQSRLGQWIGRVGHERKREIREALTFALELDDL